MDVRQPLPLNILRKGQSIMRKIFVPLEERPDIKALYYLDTPHVLFVNICGDKNGIVLILTGDTEETQGIEPVQG